MKPIKNYDQIKTDNFQRLPIDAYVCKILGVDQKTGDFGNYIEVSLDIAEGDYTDYFIEDWKNQDREDKWWKCTYRLYEVKDDGTKEDAGRAKKLKTFTTALEDSNNGYRWDWDESKWKGLKIGMIFRDKQTWKKEKDIKEGDTELVWHNAAVAWPTTVACVKAGDYRIPEPIPPKGEKPQIGSTVPGVNAFVQVADDIDEELPFK